MPQVQTRKNHARYDPAMHSFVFPILGLSFLASIVLLCLQRNWQHVWLMIILAALVVLALRTRMYSLKVQDRVIRLEEKLRLEAFLPSTLRPRISELSEKQLIAMRFAPDEELPALAARVLNEKMEPAEIKKAINNWRGDYWRV